MKKKGDNKLTPTWRGPYRVIGNLKGLGSKKNLKVLLELMRFVPEASISRQLAPETRRSHQTSVRHESFDTLPQAQSFDSIDEDSLTDSLSNTNLGDKIFNVEGSS